MFNPLSLDAPYDRLQFVNSLDIYKTCQGTDEMLDLIREIEFSENYFWQGVAFPNSYNVLVPAQQTINGSVQIPEGSYVTAINAYVDYTVNPLGCKVKIFDKGTKASIFYGDYCLERIIASNMQLRYGQGASNPPSDQGSNTDNPFGMGYLMNPFIITKPGVLGWEIVNLGTQDCNIQFMLACAVPVTRRTIGTMQVKKG